MASGIRLQTANPKKCKLQTLCFLFYKALFSSLIPILFTLLNRILLSLLPQDFTTGMNNSTNNSTDNSTTADSSPLSPSEPWSFYSFLSSLTLPVFYLISLFGFLYSAAKYYKRKNLIMQRTGKLLKIRGEKLVEMGFSLVCLARYLC